MVNNRADEMYALDRCHLAKLNAKDGMFSVLGNHDYGDYIQWKDPEKAKSQNMEKPKRYVHEANWL